MKYFTEPFKKYDGNWQGICHYKELQNRKEFFKAVLIILITIMIVVLSSCERKTITYKQMYWISLDNDGNYSHIIVDSFQMRNLHEIDVWLNGQRSKIFADHIAVSNHEIKIISNEHNRKRTKRKTTQRPYIQSTTHSH